MADFSDRVKALRIQKEQTHSQLAALFGKSEGAVRSWETGRAKPDTETLINLAQYFECTTDYLLGLSEFKNQAQAEQTNAAIADLYDTINVLPEPDRVGAIDAINALMDFKSADFLPQPEQEGYYAFACGLIYALKTLSLLSRMLELRILRNEIGDYNELGKLYLEIVKTQSEIVSYVDNTTRTLISPPLKKIREIVSGGEEDQEISMETILQELLNAAKEEVRDNAET